MTESESALTEEPAMVVLLKRALRPRIAIHVAAAIALCLVVTGLVAAARYQPIEIDLGMEWPYRGAGVTGILSCAVKIVGVDRGSPRPLFHPDNLHDRS